MANLWLVQDLASFTTKQVISNFDRCKREISEYIATGTVPAGLAKNALIEKLTGLSDRELQEMQLAINMTSPIEELWYLEKLLPTVPESAMWGLAIGIVLGGISLSVDPSLYLAANSTVLGGGFTFFGKILANQYAITAPERRRNEIGNKLVEIAKSRNLMPPSAG